MNLIVRARKWTILRHYFPPRCNFFASQLINAKVTRFVVLSVCVYLLHVKSMMTIAHKKRVNGIIKL